MTLPWTLTPARAATLRALGVAAAPVPTRPTWTTFPDIVAARHVVFSVWGPAWLLVDRRWPDRQLVLPEAGEPRWVPAVPVRAG